MYDIKLSSILLEDGEEMQDVKKWVCSHYICVHLLGLLTILGNTNLDKYFTNDTLSLIAITSSWLTTVLGLASSTILTYILVWRPR